MASYRYSHSKYVIKDPKKILTASKLSNQIYRHPSNINVLTKVQDKTLYVCFRGCNSLNDYIKSIDIRSCKISGETMKIHNGYCENIRNSIKDLEHEILTSIEKNPIQDIVYTGHSAGGAMSLIFCLFLQNHLLSNDIVQHCYTFGSPKVGDRNFVETLEYIIGSNYIRCETFNDIVSLFPIHSSFEHGGIPIIFDHHINNNEFFNYYYHELVDFLFKLHQYDLLTKHKIMEMIQNHQSRKYVQDLHKFLF